MPGGFDAPDLQLLKMNRIPADQSTSGGLWHKDIDKHTDFLKRQFAGEIELCFYHAALIARIRREIDLQKFVSAFRRLWDLESDFLIKHLDTRWLVSAVDTFADHGNEWERPRALTISTFVNMVRLAETEFYLCGEPDYIEARLQKNARTYPLTRSGLVLLQICDDDTFSNLTFRLRRQLAGIPVLAAIFENILFRVSHNGTLIGRLSKHHQTQML